MGHPFFVASTFATWFEQFGDRIRCTIETDSGQRVEGARVVIAMNTTPYTYLGNTPLHLAPEASLDAPLSVAALTSLSPRMVPILVAATRRPTGLGERGGAHHWSGVEAATITSEQPFRYQLDGEALEPVTELRLEHRAKAIRLVVPAPDAVAANPSSS